MPYTNNEDRRRNEEKRRLDPGYVEGRNAYARNQRADPAYRAKQKAWGKAWRERTGYVLPPSPRAEMSPESLKAMRQYHRDYYAKTKAETPHKMLRKRLTSRLYMALKERDCARKTTSLSTLLGCSLDELRAHLEAQFPPGMAWENYGEWHVDHRQPLALFDLRDQVQLSTVMHFTNLQPLWGAENLSKGCRVK